MRTNAMTSLLGVLVLAAFSANAPLIHAQVPSDEQPLEWLRMADLESPTSVPSNAIVNQGNGSGLIVGNQTFNLVDSGVLMFDENIPTADDPCGFVFTHDGSQNTLTLSSGCTVGGLDVDAMIFSRGAVRVGVGRQAITNELEVEGDASKTSAGSWLANSDFSIKTDIQPITNAVDVLNQLRPVRFRYNDAYRAEHPTLQNHAYANFVAQEFREVFPDSVQEGQDGLLQVDSYVVRPYLVAAVQELSREVEELRADKQELMRRLAALEAKVNGN